MSVAKGSLASSSTGNTRSSQAAMVSCMVAAATVLLLLAVVAVVAWRCGCADAYTTSCLGSAADGCS
jgi:hypothetical protein